MSRLKGALFTLAVVALWTAPSAAQIGGTPFEFSGLAGWFAPDVRARVKEGPAYGATLGYRFTSNFTLEAQGLWGPSVSDLVPGDLDQNFSAFGLGMRWNLRPAEGKAVPFVVGGFNYGKTHGGPVPPDQLERGAPDLGAGLLLNVRGERTYVRLEVRDVMFRERDAKEFSNHFAARAGLQWVYGGKSKDQDLDGVRDGLDECPDTPIGATVNAKGCPSDSDGDKVLDGLDNCANTPAGCTVDGKGCPSDADGDGVCDGVDQCADTPKGATVDAKGCPSDSDGDKVLNGLDQCEGTPAGAKVDDKGCPTDEDNDGVYDGLDDCPGTTPGLKVDAKGCPIEVIERETELLDTGMIRLQNVNFETGKADLLPDSYPTLDAVGTLLLRWPQLQLEIGGHTDARGSNAANQKLSDARAKSVEAYLLQKFPGLKDAQFTTKGYGESTPIAPNTNDEGMARNRRVEFVVMNKDVLKKEIESRRLLRQGEGAPSDSTKN
jgi:outer membrane protein OmpA-like peptidoglycan-associated protein